MNNENKKIIQATVKVVGEALEKRLKPLPNKPQRNVWAHVWSSVKHKFGASYADLPDSSTAGVLVYINSLLNEEY